MMAYRLAAMVLVVAAVAVQLNMKVCRAGDDESAC
jgi:hypothetical protein